MPPPRRSALEVSFPELAEELGEEEEAETSVSESLPGRFTSESGPSSVRKDSKRKKKDSLVDARVSCPHFCSKPRVHNFAWCRHQSVIIQHPTKKTQDLSEVGCIYLKFLTF
jgi:hypothetical protein